MKNFYVITLLSIAFGFNAYSYTKSATLHPKELPQQGIHTWKIKNKTGDEIVVISDMGSLTLKRKEKKDLQHTGSELIINGVQFNTQDQVIVVYKDDNNKKLAIETSPHWDDQVRFHFGRFKKDWNYDRGFKDRNRASQKNPAPATLETPVNS